jgi:hypothetical protein
MHPAEGCRRRRLPWGVGLWVLYSECASTRRWRGVWAARLGLVVSLASPPHHISHHPQFSLLKVSQVIVLRSCSHCALALSCCGNIRYTDYCVQRRVEQASLQRALGAGIGAWPYPWAPTATHQHPLQTPNRNTSVTANGYQTANQIRLTRNSKVVASIACARATIHTLVCHSPTSREHEPCDQAPGPTPVEGRTTTHAVSIHACTRAVSSVSFRKKLT